MLEQTGIIVIGGVAIGAIIAIFIYFVRGIKKSYALTLGENEEVIKEGKLAFSNDLKNEDNPYSSDENELRDAWDKEWKSSCPIISASSSKV
ncbi:MAG: hypothetical protein ABW166_11840 [Sedimenticola sp.]